MPNNGNWTGSVAAFRCGGKFGMTDATTCSRNAEFGAKTAALTVFVKATFLLAPGESVLAREQDAAVEEEFWDDDRTRSVRVTSDKVAFRRTAESGWLFPV